MSNLGYITIFLSINLVLLAFKDSLFAATKTGQSQTIIYYNKGDKCCQNNYRPISLLPTLSKIFERVMYKQLYQYFNENKLLCEQQYGFRSQHSTELAAVKLVDYIIKEMDCNKKVKTPVALFLDLSKAFDTLTFDILLKKLKHYGVHGKSLALIKNYLTNRSQYVQIENQESCIMEIKTGILQGSILGPLFSAFLLMIL